MPKYSVKKPFTILVAVILVLVLGFVSLTASCKGLRVQRAMELLRASASARWPTARRWCEVLH